MTIRISTPTDVLDAVPALLGFYPTESLCVLYLDQTPRGLMLAMTSREDLPTTPGQMADTLDRLADLLDRHASATLLIYSADQEEARATMRRIIGRVGGERVKLALLATAPGWTMIDPAMPDAIQWTNPYPTSTGTVAADLAAQGLRAAGTRDDLADSIQAPDDETAAAYTAARVLDAVPDTPTEDDLTAMAAEVRGWITAYLAQPTTVLPDEAAYLAARIRYARPRDEAVWLLDKTTAPALTALWQAVAAMTPDHDAVPVLACLGLAAWAGSNGALANVAVERAERLPGAATSNLLALVNETLTRAIPPSLWDDVRRLWQDERDTGQ